jgi:hypothetical protein
VVVGGERVMRCARCDEVGGDKFGALMDKLVERVLPVGACGPPKNWLDGVK